MKLQEILEQPGEVYGVGDVASALGVSTSSVRTMIKSGELAPAYRYAGDRYRIPGTSVASMLQAAIVEPTQDDEDTASQELASESSEGAA